MGYNTSPLVVFLLTMFNLRLGWWRSAQCGIHPVEIAEGSSMPGRQPVLPKTFLNHIKTVDDIWERLRVDAKLHAFMHELERLAPQPARATLSDDETLVGLEIIQLMENVFLDLRLDDFWDHPDNRGWAVVFMRWAGSSKPRKIWNRWPSTFGIRFEYFLRNAPRVPRDEHSVRV